MSIDSRKLVLDEPDGMIALDERGHWVVESPDGARVWSHRLRNEPVGDAAFWLKALQERLARDFAAADISSAGGWSVLTLTSRGDEPYTWMIALQIEGPHLDLVQALLPSPAHLQRHGQAIRAALSDGGGA